MKTPELDKMLAVKEKSHAIGEFLDWLDESSLVVCEYGVCDCDECGNELYPARTSTEQLLADYFGIDLNKCEQERQQILKDIRES